MSTCTLSDHLEALKISDRIVAAVRGAIPEEYWDLCSVEVTQTRNVSKDPKWMPRSHVTLWTHFGGANPLPGAREIEAKILGALRTINFGFLEAVEERRDKDLA